MSRCAVTRGWSKMDAAYAVPRNAFRPSTLAFQIGSGGSDFTHAQADRRADRCEGIEPWAMIIFWTIGGAVRCIRHHTPTRSPSWRKGSC